jgi:hypothetical protein
MLSCVTAQFSIVFKSRAITCTISIDYPAKYVYDILSELTFSYLLETGGFAFLPFLWFINSVWFFKEAFLKPQYQQQKQIKTCKFVMYNINYPKATIPAAETNQNM